MELELTRIDFDADVYDVRKAVQEVLHGPNFYDPNDPENKGRKPNFEVLMGESSAGRIHNGKAALRLPTKLGSRLYRWYKESDEHRVMVNGRPLRLLETGNPVPPDVKQMLEKAPYIDPDQDKIRNRIEVKARQVRLQIAKVQFGVWYKPANSPGTGRSFSVEYERDFLYNSAACIYVEYEHKLICIDIGQRETEDTNYLIHVKFSSIRKLGLGYDGLRQPFIIFDLYMPPSFERRSYNNRFPEDIECNGKCKRGDRISAIDNAHASIAEYAHHLRIVLANTDDLLQFEKICHITQCEPRPVHVSGVDVHAMRFFSHRDLVEVERWINTMDWKNAFQIEAYLRGGLLNTHDLLATLKKPIEEAIKYYGAESSEFLRLFYVGLKTRKAVKDPRVYLEDMRKTHKNIKPHRLKQGYISCHHVVITPSRILLEGPYTTQSNLVIQRYQDHDPALAERFIRVEFRDEDGLAYRWDSDVDGKGFLEQRVGGILRRGFELSGRVFEFLTYSLITLNEHSVWFVAPFHDPIEGYVTAEKIRSSFRDSLKPLRTPSKYASRIVLAYAARDRGMIRRDQWEEQPELGPHTDGVGTISPELADMIWDEKCKTNRDPREHRVRPSAYQFRFLGYKGVVVVDNRLKGIKMRLRQSQCNFPFNNAEEADIEIVRSFDHPSPVHLNRSAVMVLEDRGIKLDTFLELQAKAEAEIYLSSSSLEAFKRLLGAHGLGGKYHLDFILEHLIEHGLDFKDGTERKAIKGAFLERLLRCSMQYSLRELKFKARIPVPHSYQLVGVADEGRAYINEGVNENDVFTLKPGTIFVCVQESVNEPPIYLSGDCVISRSPTMHPGDMRRVFAVGKPPEDKICFFRGLKNVVVLPAVGERSLASCLSGGDLDGDTYDIYFGNPGLLPPLQADPAEYSHSNPRTLEESRGDTTAEDMCDFIVEYIHNDVMDLLADRHIVIADQSKDGVFDFQCMKFAGLRSQTVDYAKNGNPTIIDDIPKPLIKFKPDWYKAEIACVRELDYYVSDRALGYLFRGIELLDLKQPIQGLSTEGPGTTAPLEDAVTQVIRPLVRNTLNLTYDDDTTAIESSADDSYAEQLHAHYVHEMGYICVTYSLADSPDVCLTEEEVVLGTILANCAQPRRRSDRSCRMNLHAEGLVDDIYTQIVEGEEGPRTATDEQLRTSLVRAWAAWCWTQHHREMDYIESFALLVLRIVFDCLKRLGGLPKT